MLAICTTIFIGLTLSFICGYVVAIVRKSVHNIVGTLRVDNSLPEEGPHLYLELDKDIPEIKQRDYVTLRVNTKSYISQK